MDKQNQTYIDIVNKCWEDEVFKERFIANPTAELETTFGKRYTPENGKPLKVLDQVDSNVININIPPRPEMDDLELTDEQLEQVAGGITVITTSSYWCISGAGVLVGLAISAID